MHKRNWRSLSATQKQNRKLEVRESEEYVFSKYNKCDTDRYRYLNSGQKLVIQDQMVQQRLA